MKDSRESRLTRVQRLLRLLAFGDVSGDSKFSNDLAALEVGGRSEFSDPVFARLGEDAQLIRGGLLTSTAFLIHLYCNRPVIRMYNPYKRFPYPFIAWPTCETFKRRI